MTQVTPTPTSTIVPASPSSLSAKIVVAGGFGVGKTTFVNSVSEIPPLQTEEHMTDAARSIDDLSKVTEKKSTTVAMDFGRITVSPEIVVFLFGTPGQDRFAFLWDKICLGAIGAVLLVDTRRLDESFGPIDYLESRGIPFVIGVNTFADSPGASASNVREALALAPDFPVVGTDARDRTEVKSTLVALIDHLLRQVP